MTETKNNQLGMSQAISNLSSDRLTNDYLPKVITKMATMAQNNKGKIPYTLKEDGTYNDLNYLEPFYDGGGIEWWTNGFFGGILWLLYHKTKNGLYAGYAREQEALLDLCFDRFNGIHHDVGFMWLLTAVADYKISGDRRARDRGLHAATILAGRFNIKGNFIRAWGNHDYKITGWSIIDSLMNISILYWATKETEDPRYEAIAKAHADTLIQYYIRQDGACYHIGEFDPKTGEFLKAHSGQGMKNPEKSQADNQAVNLEDSQENSQDASQPKGLEAAMAGDVYGCWSRGQAWAVYGLTNSYLNTGLDRYKEAAIKVSDYFMDGFNKRGYVPVDFRQPEGESREDNSAACIAASGLIDLGRGMGTEGQKYLDAGIRILTYVCENRISLDSTMEATVLKCAVDYHNDKTTETLIYADYFLLEALLKLNEEDLRVWMA